MFNASVVNGEASCSPCAYFSEILPVFGRFPRFKNPVKYTGNLQINQDSLHNWATKPKATHIFHFISTSYLGSFS